MHVMADDGDVVKYGYHEKPLRLNIFLCVFYAVSGTQCHVNGTQSTYCTLDTIKGLFTLGRKRYRFQMSSKKGQFIHVYIEQRQRSKKNFAFAFAEAQCKRTLRIIDSTK